MHNVRGLVSAASLGCPLPRPRWPRLATQSAAHGASTSPGQWGVIAAVDRQQLAPWWQRRHKISIPEKELIKKTSRSSGPGGQSVNMSDSRVQLSFHLDKAEWVPEGVRAKMREIHKNRINKKGEFSVACQVASSQLDNYRIALRKIQEHLTEAEEAIARDKKEAEKLPYKEFQLEKKRREGKEKEIEKHVEAIKAIKRHSRQRTNDKQGLKKMAF
mmetsp:Transcript_35554/g.82548  ORF Transcript_35554/g.82548 Transcript_35554/m.82548 type:complete len:216 (-) Transcript_35554:73-720(-)